MALRGMVSARMGVLPSELNKATHLELQYWLYWNQKVEVQKEQRMFETIGRMLGTVWKRGDFAPRSKKAPKDKDTIIYTLADLLSPKDFRKSIKNEFANLSKRGDNFLDMIDDNEEVVELDERFDKDVFTNLIGSFNLNTLSKAPPTKKPGS